VNISVHVGWVGGWGQCLTCGEGKYKVKDGCSIPTPSSPGTSYPWR
jgi:hypothetical protein